MATHTSTVPSARQKAAVVPDHPVIFCAMRAKKPDVAVEVRGETGVAWRDITGTIIGLIRPVGGGLPPPTAYSSVPLRKINATEK